MNLQLEIFLELRVYCICTKKLIHIKVRKLYMFSLNCMEIFVVLGIYNFAIRLLYRLRRRS